MQTHREVGGLSNGNLFLEIRKIVFETSEKKIDEIEKHSIV